MALEEDIYTLLNGATAASERVYPLIAPAGVLSPYVTWQRITSSPVSSFSGASGLDAVIIQFNCWATTLFNARALALQLRGVLEASSLKVLLQNDGDDYDDGVSLYRSRMDFRVWTAV